jgi:hypothetical protein
MRRGKLLLFWLVAGALIAIGVALLIVYAVQLGAAG